MVPSDEIEGPDPLDLILMEHAEHEKLCDLLEEIADSLPNDVDKEKVLQAVDKLKLELPLHHRVEEEALFPILEKYSNPKDNVADIVGRLSEEHVVDESFADELVEILELLSAGHPVEDANTFGYMLRGFFENYRRHINWENNVVLPLARRRLPAKGLQELYSTMKNLKQHPHAHNRSKEAARSIAVSKLNRNGECKD